MSNNNKYFIEEAEYLRKRAWDFIDKLEKLEKELEKAVDTDKHGSLQLQFSNTKLLLENYKNDYEAMCEQAGIPPEIIGIDVSYYDAVPSRSRNIKNDQHLDMPPLFLVPSRNPMFRGRQNEVREVIQQILKGKAFALCGSKGKGMGGIGKTEIAKEICHIFNDTWQNQSDLPENLTDLLGQKEGGFFRDGILWIQFHSEGQTPNSLIDDLFLLLIKNVEANEEIKNLLHEIAKLNLDTLVDTLVGKDMLMVLDNVEQNLRTFDYVLERFKGRFPLLITSRIAITGIKSIDIDVLTGKEAEDLFLCYMDTSQLIKEEQEIVREFCRLLDNYPLPIKIIASLVKKNNLADLIDTYKEKRKYLQDTVRTCFMMSFNSLNEEEQHIVRHAALFNNSFANSFTVEALVGLLDVIIIDKEEKEKKLKELDRIVNQLERLSMINCLHGRNRQENTYQLHPLIGEFALDLLMQTVEINSDRKEKIEILLKELQQAKKKKVLPRQLEKDPVLVQQIVDAVQYCDQTYDFPTALKFMKVLDGQLDNLNCWDERLRLNQLMIRATVALRQEFDEGIYRKQRADIEKQQAMFKNTFDFVGRKKELDYFKDEFLFLPGAFILNFHTKGDGGVGKTQLLQQILKLCRSRYSDRVISSDELIDFYYTEARSKAGIIEQIIMKLGIDHFPHVDRQLKKYRRTKDSSERQYILDDTVTALRKDYAVFAALSERADKIIALFFDTYEVIQFVGKKENTVERSDFSEWLEKKLFPALQSDNTRLVIAGRYPLINAAKNSIVTKPLLLFKDEEAINFLAEYLKVAEFSTEEYQCFLGVFPLAEDLLQPFRCDLDAERIGIRMYEFPNGHRKELGEEIWQALKDKVPVKQEKELLDELKLTGEELKTVIELAGNRPIYLALFMDWVRFSKAKPGKLVKKIQSVPEKEAQRELFENKILAWLWTDPDTRRFIYYMTVAYRRMTAEIMQHLTGNSLEHCEKILLEDIRHFSFTKYKKDEEKGDVVLLHDEMRDLITKRWQNRIDPDEEQKKEILKKLIHYYEENLLSPDYILTDISYSRLEQQKVPKNIIDTIKSVTSLFFTEDSFVSALHGQNGLTQDELDSYLPEIVREATQEVSQKKREAYTPELIEYAFMADADDGVQRFCEEFDIAIEDGRPAYVGLLGSEAVRCHKKYGASQLYALQIDLRDVQHYIDSDKPEDLNKALKIIKSLNEHYKNDASWKDSLLFGQFTLWKGIAEFWQDKFDGAIDSLKEAWRVFINYDEQQDLVYLAENWIGYVYYRKADFIEAEYWMKISLEGLIDLLSNELDNNKKKRKRNLQQRIQYSLGNLAILYRYTGKFIEAIRYAEMQLNIVQSLPRNKKEILRSLNTLSHVLAIAGRNIDARHYLEEAKKIYKEIPDRLLGGRVYSNFCQLSYGTMEFAHLIECYRAEELHKAVKSSSGTHVQEYIDYAKEAIQLLEKKPAFHKELADAYFSLGELYMMMPAKHIEGDKWDLAEQTFKKALDSAKESQFQYRIIDTLESLVTLYYFQSQAENLSPDQKRACEEKQKQRQNEIEKDWKIQQYPNLAGRYELTQGDIHFDKALEKLKAEYPEADEGVGDLLKAFNHYIRSAACKKKFNINRYYLMLRVIYNRLDKLVELAHPLTFPRLESLDYQRQEELREESLISRNALSLLAQNHAAWETNVEDFRSFKRIFEYALLLGKKTVPEGKLKRLEKELEECERVGEYWNAVLVNKCLTELYWIQANLSTDILKKEDALEQLVFHLNQQSRQYRLMGDSFHARRSYKRAEKIITEQITSNPKLKKGLEGYTAIVKGEYLLRRAEFANLLESLVAGELEDGRKKFEKQFSYLEEKTKEKVSALEKAGKLFKKGQELLEQALQDDQPKRDPYQKKLAESYFMSGDLFILMGRFSEAFDCLEKCIEKCSEKEDDCRLDDAKQSYLSAFYFSLGNCGKSEYQEKMRAYKQDLEKKIQSKDYSRPWVAARFRITEGDILFSECYRMEDKFVSSDSSSYKFIARKKVERRDIVQIFRKYIEACNYKASYNELSFEAGLWVLRRRIEMIPDSAALDILRDIFRQLWQDGEYLRKKKEELDSILQLIRMRSLILQYEEH
ncbi:hypothetical protein GMJAKD_08725 [Candidatus Electrothrix aarhusensis]